MIGKKGKRKDWRQAAAAADSKQSCDLFPSGAHVTEAPPRAARLSRGGSHVRRGMSTPRRGGGSLANGGWLDPGGKVKQLLENRRVGSFHVIAPLVARSALASVKERC